jgi:hypothetical protein
MTPALSTRARRHFAACVACVVVAACGLQPGERFGRPGAEPGRLRVQIFDDALELDPARAKTPIERAVARQLFSAVVENGKPSLASSWDVVDREIVFHLRDARFTDGTSLGAHEIVWSWRRALRPSTGTSDTTPLSIVKNGTELARGALLRVSKAGVRGRAAPYAIYRDGPGDAVNDVEMPAGAAVRVIDSNEREPCCNKAVPLHGAPDSASAAPAALVPGEVAVVIGARAVRSHDGRERLMLRLRAPGGASGWVQDDEVAAHIPAIGLVPVVDRGGVAPTLRAGPDDGAPARATLGDDDLVEMIERGPDHCLVVDAKSGRTGFINCANIDDTVRERRWFLVAPLGSDASRAWLPEQDLAFDPSLLEARAIDDHTLSIQLANGVDVDRAIAALSESVMRPVPPRIVEEDGREWTKDMPTSGPFVLASHDAGARLVLQRSPTSAERERAKLDRVELVVVSRPTTALHLYRAGVVDALLDGSLPADLAPTLARAADFVAGATGGALVAPEVHGFSPAALELRDVDVEVAK